MSKKKNNLNYIPASAKTAAQKKEEAKQNNRENLSPELRAKLLKKRAWTLSVISLCLVVVLTLSIMFASYTPTLYKEKTNSAPDSTVTEGIIANEQFGLSKLLYNGKTSSILQQPYLPSGWTLSDKSASQSVTGVVSRDANNNSKVENDLAAAGIASDDIDAILANTDATADTADKDVLLIYNKTATNARATSSSFTVSANGYLEIKVKVRTSVTSGDGAFISLKTSTSDSATAELSFTGINHSEWKEYTFYLEGSKTSSKTLYLFVGLGSSSSAVQGWAEFDYAIAENAKKADYISKVEDGFDETVIKTKSYVSDVKEENLFESKFATSTVMTGGTQLTGEVSGEYELPFYNQANLPVYKISNSASSNVNSVFMKLTNKLDIQQSTASPYYRLSFWAKTTDLKLETGAYFYVRLYKEDGSTEFKSINLVSTSEDADDKNSGWQEYSFLFQPDNTASYQAEIVFSLGSLVYGSNGYQPAITDVKTTGNLYVTEFELKEIYPSEYNSASAGDNLAKVALSSSTSTGLITNGSFNSPVANASTNSSVEAFDPNGWSIVVPRSSTDAGYVYVPHTNSDLMFGILSKTTAGGMNEYFGHTGDDNILAVSINNPTAIGFVSNTITIPANSIYTISVLAKATAGANANVYLTGDVEASYAVSDIDSDKYYSWQEFNVGGYTKYNFIIKTGDVAKQVSLELWAGSKDVAYASGSWDSTKLAAAGSFVAFDEASADSMSEDQFRSLVESKENDENVFVKTETEDFIKDEDGNPTEDKEVVDVAYSTEKQNVIVKDFSYADETGAIDTNDDETTEEKVEEVAPVDWLLFSSLVLSLAAIFFLIAMICKKFKKVKKETVVIEDPDYKN